MNPAETSVFDAIRREIADEYAQPHEKPWIVGFSGGKDSTLVAHLVVEHLLSIPRSERIRPVHVVANDTLVESPLVIGHVKEGLDEIRRASAAFDLPVVVAATAPSPDQTFWVNLIGRGYPSPNRSFRWCTDRMKILPTSRYIRNQANLAGEVILLLGVRRSESATRAGVVARYDNFDGEQVQRYAGRDMSKQVRDGIEGLLGLPVLRVLKDSLEKYAQNRRTRSAKPSDERVNAVKSAIEELENRIERRKAQRDEADAHLSALQNASSTPRKRSLARSAPSSEGTCRASGGVPPTWTMPRGPTPTPS